MSECINKSQWKDYFDDMSKVLGDVPVEVEVEGLGIFDKVEVEWLPLKGITYDPKDNVVSLMFDKLDHMVEKPYEIEVEKGEDGVKTISFTSEGDGAKTVVKFKNPVKV